MISIIISIITGIVEIVIAYWAVKLAKIGNSIRVRLKTT